MPMYTSYLSISLFNKSCRPIIEIIYYYRLSKLVYCTNSINVGRHAELYNSIKIDVHTYTTRSGGRDIIFTPDLLRDHLEIRHSSSTLYFPPRALL